MFKVMDIHIPVARTVDVGETSSPGEESDGEDGRDGLSTPIAWTADVGETSPPAEQSDGEEDWDALGMPVAWTVE